MKIDDPNRRTRPSGSENRMSLRAERMWRRLLSGGMALTEREASNLLTRMFAPNLIHYEHRFGAWQHRWIGERLAALIALRPLVDTAELPEVLKGRASAAADGGAPMHFELLPATQGLRYAMRGVALPIAPRGQAIDQVLLVANCTEEPIHAGSA